MKILPYLLLVFLSQSGFAFDPKTHVWVSQEVINDLEDGKLTVNGREYPVSSDLREAILNHKSAYRMGSIGPDAHPDILVGQILIHPGHKGASQADEWLATQQLAARDPEAKAYAFGAWTHAASDIFSHSYVNEYSGGVFELTDGESEIEARHFILEKFIGKRTPALRDHRGQPLGESHELVSTPRFIADHYVFNEEIFEKEYLKSPQYSAPLIAMHVTYGVSKLLSDGLKTIQEHIPNFVILSREQLSVVEDKAKLVNAKIVAAGDKVAAQVKKLEGLQVDLNQAEKMARGLESKITEFATSISTKATEIKNLESLTKKVTEQLEKTLQPSLTKLQKSATSLSKKLTTQNKTVRSLDGKLTALDKKIREKEKALSRTPKSIEEKYRKKVEKEVCRGALSVVCRTVSNWVNATRKVANPSYANISNAVQGLKGDRKKIEKELSKAKKAAGNISKALAETKKKVKGAAKKVAKATADKKKYAAAMTAAKKAVTDLQSELKPVQESLQAAVETVKETTQKIADVEAAKKAIFTARDQMIAEGQNLQAQSEELLDNIGLAEGIDFHGLIEKANYWHRDVKEGVHAYMQAGTDTVASAMQNEGVSKFIEPYENWNTCWLPVFVKAVPRNTALAACGAQFAAEDWLLHIEQVKSKLLRRLASHVPIAQKMVETIDRWKELAKEEAFTRSVGMISREYRQFISTISGPITQSELNSIYGKDDSGLGLIRFGKISQLIDRDLGSEGESSFDPSVFRAAKNAVQLAKMTLLDPAQLNQIARDNGSSVELYQTQNFINVLNKVAKSIDGHFQWTGLDTLLQREDGTIGFATAGYNGWDSAQNVGFRFYQGENEASNVFPKLFHLPLTQMQLD